MTHVLCPILVKNNLVYPTLVLGESLSRRCTTSAKASGDKRGAQDEEAQEATETPAGFEI